jgi:hypothetical protein
MLEREPVAWRYAVYRYVFRTSLTTDSHYFPEQHLLVLLCNRQGLCSLRGRDQIVMHYLYGVKQSNLQSLN